MTINFIPSHVDPTDPEEYRLNTERYFKDVFDDVSKSCADKLAVLKKAIEENMGIADLIAKYPNEFTIFLENTCSGINVVNLTTGEICEWTW